MARITVFDTTLRDGEQSPGCSMTAPEKLRLAHELAELGVDVLEAGFAASSPEDAESIRSIAARTSKGRSSRRWRARPVTTSRLPPPRSSRLRALAFTSSSRHRTST